jgi:hypothetical protein
MDLLSWQLLLFLLPLAFGVVLVAGAALGLGSGAGDGVAEGGGPDGAAGAHAGGGGGGGAPSDGAEGPDAGGAQDGHGAFALLALGRLPLTMRLMLLTLLFGGAGLVATFLLAALAATPRALAAAGLAAGFTLFVGGRLARLLARHVPALETETVRREDLVGCTGTLVLGATADGGLAQVHDRRGNLHQVACRVGTGDPPLPPGTGVLLVEYEAPRARFVVTRGPFGA